LRFALAHPSPPESPLLRDTIDRLYAYADPASLSAEAIADVNAALDTDAVFVTRLEPARVDAVDPAAPRSCTEPGRLKLETRMLSGRDADVVSILYAVECLPAASAAHLAWNPRALAIYGVLVLLAIVRLVRGWGTLVVSIELPPRTRGFLHIRIASKPQQIGEARRKTGRNEGRLRRSLRSFSRFEKHMASRETVFRWIPARTRPYYVTVRGPLYDAMGGQEIGRFLEEQTVRIERGRVARLSYDFDPDEVALQVSVVQAGQPVRGARVALRDDPNSLRYAHDGSAFFYVGQGQHTLCAGGADRATERDVEISALGQAVSVIVDLSDEASLLVQDCPAAVEPYLLGDFATAAEALAAAGQARLADLMRGAHHQQRGETEAAAAAYEAAGFIEEAAELRASGADHGASAELYERAGDAARAAEAYRAAGRPGDAARCYEAAYDYHNAIECWEEVGDAERVIDLRQKLGEYLDAARLAFEHDLLDAALHALQQIERRDPNFPEACRLMADVLERRGEFELAAERQGQAIELAGAEHAPVELHERLAELLLRADDKQRALAALETVRRLDPSRTQVIRHIEALRRELSSAPAASGDAGGTSRYELLEEIGRGGMGVVYKARDTRLGRIVALKRLPDELRDNQTAARLFLREAQAAAALNHRNIVTVYDAGEENGVYHITMELLEGMPLNRIQDRRGRIGARDVARLGIQVCAGLQYAHERRVVHRDIKTANLFFTRDKVVKIMDFGLAKTIEEVRRNSTVIGGTPYYMAPEQAAGEPVDHRTDLYAFGVTCFRLLTGEFPFREGDLVHHHRHTPPPDPREWLPDLPAGLAELVLQLLAKAPDERPGDAAEVAARLRAAFDAA
jgi:tetratricopeptide (TPR) repeat protein